MKDFISNIGVITALLFFTSLIFKNETHYSHHLRLGKRALFGFINGCYGVFIMYFGIQIPPHTMFDLRQMFIIVAANFGGVISAGVAAFVIAVGRIVLFGGWTPSSVDAVLGLAAVAIGAGVLFEMRNGTYWSKWLISLIIMMLSIIAIAFDLLATERAYALMVRMIPVVGLGGIFVAALIRFLVRSNQLAVQYQQEATTDFLTGLANVRAFDRQWNELIQQAVRKEEYLSLMLLDLDFFKMVNDNFGHPAGDAVLRELSGIVTGIVPHTDVVARVGGEEFSIILPGCHPDTARKLGESIRQKVERHAFTLPGGMALRLTVSIGISSYPTVPAEVLLDRTDEALYEAKHSGRNRVCVL